MAKGKSKSKKFNSNKPLESVNDFISRARANPKAYGSKLAMEWIIYGKLRLAATANGDVDAERHARMLRLYAEGNMKAIRKMNVDLAIYYGEHVWTHANVEEASRPVTRTRGKRLEFPPSKPPKSKNKLTLQCGCEIHETKGVIGTEMLRTMGVFSKARKQAKNG